MTQTEHYLKSQIIATEEDILRIRQEILEESDIFKVNDLEIELLSSKEALKEWQTELTEFLELD